MADAAFEAVVEGDYIIGRGVQDDKGPSMAALFAVKALLDAGVQFNKRIRFILEQMKRPYGGV